MKFLLVVHVCSIVAQNCMEGIKVYPMYDTFHQCTIAGHVRSMGIVSEMGQDLVDRTKTVIHFDCESIELT